MNDSDPRGMRRIALACALCGALVLSLTGCDLQNGGVDAAGARRARGFQAFPLYWVGERFGDLPLTAFVRTQQPATAAARAAGFSEPVNDVTLVYGTCHASSDSGCVPPLEIQMSTECRGNFAGDHLTPGPGPPLTHLWVAGVPAVAIGIGSNHLELFSGRVTISIFGSRALALRVAAALTPANEAARSLARLGVRLPPPRPADRCMTG
jgi:hypothetical protein